MSKLLRAAGRLYLCSLRRPKMAIGDLQALRELGPPNSAGARADGLLTDLCMFKSNLAKYRNQLHLGDGGYKDLAKVGLRLAEVGVYVDGEVVFEAAPDGQEAFRIVQRKREMAITSYSDLQCWKDNFKEECYQEWLTRTSPGGLDECTVQHMISIN